MRDYKLLGMALLVIFCIIVLFSMKIIVGSGGGGP